MIDQRFQCVERESDLKISVSKPLLPVLNLSGLRVERGPVTILHNLSWRVEAGQHWVILGPNGCGKTSLLRALTGYLTPSSGGITVLDKSYGECDWRDLRLLIGIVSSSLQVSIPPAEPAIETVISGKYAQLDLWGKTTRKDYTEAMRLLHIVGVEYLAKRDWWFLSQGERQRVLIARALMARPSLLILDEPCAGLDPVAREHFLTMMNDLGGQRGTLSQSGFAAPSLVLVTHHVEEITSSFTHALFMRGGTTLAAGPIKSTLTNKNLSAAFGTSLRIGRRDARYYLQIPRGPHSPATL